MPETTVPGVTSAALNPDEGSTIPRIALTEQGTLGLKVRSKQIVEEVQSAFRYPQFISTVNEMRNNPTVGAAMNVYRMMISRVKWKVVPSEDGSYIDKQRAALIESMMHDMDHSWGSFIESIVPYLEYGFAINEMVLRRRLKRNGSKYNDGIVGLKRLPPRSQDTIVAWNFTQDGTDLVSVEQTVRDIENPSRFASRVNENGRLTLDREKILLFTASSTKGNPQGNSIYKNIYLAYKQLSLLQDQELIGIAKDIQGILKIGIPPRYLDPNAPAADKAVVTQFQQIIDNYNAGVQRGLLVPLMYDPDVKQPMFSYDLMESKGSAKYDTESVIRRLQGDILSALNVDILKLGADGTGSFSLAESKNSVLALAIDYRLREIASVLNSELMRTLYEMNGWDTANMAKFTYEDVEQISLEEFSKAVQRIFSTSAIEVDRQVLNRIRTAMGIPEKADDEPVDKESLPSNMSGNSSRSGDGMAVGTTGNGTSKTPTGQDPSTNNADNTA